MFLAVEGMCFFELCLGPCFSDLCSCLPFVASDVEKNFTSVYFPSKTQVTERFIRPYVERFEHRKSVNVLNVRNPFKVVI